jgi:hypothetical protein
LTSQLDQIASMFRRLRDPNSNHIPDGTPSGFARPLAQSTNVFIAGPGPRSSRGRFRRSNAGGAPGTVDTADVLIQETRQVYKRNVVAAHDLDGVLKGFPLRVQ